MDTWVKKSENDSKRKRSKKDGEANQEAKKSKSLTPVEESMVDFDFSSCDKTTADGKSWNLKISSWNVAGLRAWVKVRLKRGNVLKRV